MATPDPNIQLVVALETSNRVLVELAQTALKEAGIKFGVQDPEPTEFGFTPILNPVYRILVSEEDEARAHKELAPLLSPGPEFQDDRPA
jgi:Putative prokaryotic signal transducing protein